ncbi:MAG: FIST N-terminal domain-containing protein [Pseudomonadota bacterium]
MKWASLRSDATEIETALDELVAACPFEDDADIAFLFVSGQHRAHFDRLPAMLRERIGIRCLVGCSASGVVGGGDEVEHRASLGLTLGCLPDVRVDYWHIDANELGPGSAHSERCAALAARLNGKPAQILILADPFSFPAEQLLRSLEGAFPTSVIAGGLASGGQAAGEIAVFVDDTAHYSGALVVALEGDIEVVSAVAQGCRPIGEPMFISAYEQNKITSLDGKAPMELLAEVFTTLSESDKALVRHSLFLGLAMDPGESMHKRGDFLVRNIMGIEQESGALWVGAEVREHQVVQFHLRDAQTSSEDLKMQLQKMKGRLDPSASGALLFSCTGRGRGLYGLPNHDSDLMTQQVGEIPIGGFFCNGEIGQVGSTTFLHGYTSAIVVFQKPSH